MSTKRVIVRGHVHNVGFRDWTMHEARALGLSGWVRNRRDGTLELLLDGEANSVEEMLRACRRGPRHAEVDEVEEHAADPPAQEGFSRLPDA